MPLELGTTIGYHDYIKTSSKRKANAVLWRKSSVSDALQNVVADVQGTLALTNEDARSPTTVAPGLSIVIQSLAPDQTSPLHTHSFWHLYVVSSGEGVVLVDVEDQSQDLRPGDILFVPAWTPHAVANPGGREPLVLIRMQNLPEMAEIGALAREVNKQPKLIYSTDH